MTKFSSALAPRPASDGTFYRSLFGHAIDESGAPLSGASIWLILGDRYTTTDDEGAFAFPSVPPGTYLLRATAGDLSSEVTTVAIGEKASEAVALILKRGATVVVRVFGGEGEPVVGAEVTANCGPDPAGGWTATTDPTGTAILRGVRSLRDGIRVQAIGWATEHLRARSSDRDPTGVFELFVSLRRGATVEGIVIDPDKVPIANATVSFMDGSRPGARIEVDSDRDGSWRVEALAVGTYMAQATASTYAPGTGVVLTIDDLAPRSGVVVQLSHGLALRGRVVDVTGTPVTDAEVDILLGGEGGVRVLSGSDGAFEVHGLLAAGYLLRARKGQLASVSQAVGVGESADEVTIVLKPSTISGIVTDIGGNPIGGAEVRAISESFDEPYWEAPSRTDDHGRFEIGGIEPGQYRLRASRQNGIVKPSPDPAFKPPSVPARAGDTDVRLTLPPCGAITGRVLFENEPVKYFGIRIAPSESIRVNGNWPTIQRSIDGQFELTCVEPGTWGIAVLAEHSERKFIEGITVRGGERTALGDIVLARGIRLRGYVRNASGHAVSGATVVVGHTYEGQTNSLLLQWFDGVYRAITDASGQYVLDGIAPEHGFVARPKIHASHPKWGSSSLLVPDGDAVLNFDLSPAETAEGPQ